MDLKCFPLSLSISFYHSLSTSLTIFDLQSRKQKKKTLNLMILQLINSISCTQPIGCRSAESKKEKEWKRANKKANFEGFLFFYFFTQQFCIEQEINLVVVAKFACFHLKRLLTINSIDCVSKNICALYLCGCLFTFILSVRID